MSALTSQEILDLARHTFEVEAEALNRMAGSVNENFVIAVERMLAGKAEEQVEVFNLGTGRGLSVLEIVNTFMQVTGVDVPYEIVGRREGDIEQVWAKPDKANIVLGWSADTPIEEVLLSAWKWEQKIRS